MVHPLAVVVLTILTLAPSLAWAAAEPPLLNLTLRADYRLRVPFGEGSRVLEARSSDPAVSASPSNLQRDGATNGGVDLACVRQGKATVMVAFNDKAARRWDADIVMGCDPSLGPLSWREGETTWVSTGPDTKVTMVSSLSGRVALSIDNRGNEGGYSGTCTARGNDRIRYTYDWKFSMTLRPGMTLEPGPVAPVTAAPRLVVCF